MTQANPTAPLSEDPSAQIDETPDFDLDDPSLYLNRELTWLSFNGRVLNEAAQARNPLLERVKFLAIVSNNLDEFFMKRIGGLKQQLAAGVATPTVDGRTPAQAARWTTASKACFSKSDFSNSASVISPSQSSKPGCA